jgi:hypothetical protein
MKRILILCEGQTEETFVTRILAPHLLQFDKVITPTGLVTKKVKSGQEFQGGVTSYARVRRNVYSLLRDSNAVCITTMLDYYGPPPDFPGKATLSATTPYDRVAHLEKAFAEDIDHPRFRPYLMLHEFEALLFVQPSAIPTALSRGPADASFKNIGQFDSPEEINEGEKTHPAARIMQVLPGYRKALHGPLIAERIGLPNLRARCPHFAAWLNYLEAL